MSDDRLRHDGSISSGRVAPGSESATDAASVQLVDVGMPSQRARQSVAVAAEGTDSSRPIALNRPRGELADLLAVSYPRLKLSDVFLNEADALSLRRLADEQQARDVLASHGLEPRTILTLSGPVGSGKTRVAACLAGELSLPLFTVLPPQPGDREPGLTDAQLSQLISDICSVRGVYLIDMDRCLSASGADEREEVAGRLTHGIEVGQARSGAVDSVVVLSTTSSVKHCGALSSVGQIVDLGAPDAMTCRRIIESIAGYLLPRRVDWTWVIDACAGLSQGQIAAAANDLVKTAMLATNEPDPVTRLVDTIRTRRRHLRQRRRG